MRATVSTLVSSPLRVGGMTPLTTIDFPGRLAAVVFLQGCPWRCSYCQNPALIPALAEGTLPWQQVLEFLQRRRGLLDGLVFSGGEPSLQQGLGAAIDDVRALGFQIGLHSAGMYPEHLGRLLPKLDWIGLDVKARWHRHDRVNGVPGSGEKVRAALQQVLAAGIAYECRTTWHPGLYPLEELACLAQDLRDAGVRNWSLQLAREQGRATRQESIGLAKQDLLQLGVGFDDFQLR